MVLQYLCNCNTIGTFKMNYSSDIVKKNITEVKPTLNKYTLKNHVKANKMQGKKLKMHFQMSG